jgi:hypothetical protein
MTHWWRSRFSRLLSGKFKLSVSVVFDFATSITLGAYGSLAEEELQSANNPACDE